MSCSTCFTCSSVLRSDLLVSVSGKCKIGGGGGFTCAVVEEEEDVDEVGEEASSIEGRAECDDSKRSDSAAVCDVVLDDECGLFSFVISAEDTDGEDAGDDIGCSSPGKTSVGLFGEIGTSGVVGGTGNAAMGVIFFGSSASATSSSSFGSYGSVVLVEDTDADVPDADAVEEGGGTRASHNLLSEVHNLSGG